MVHAGYEPSAVLGGNQKFGDTWKMLKWQLSGQMGGRIGPKVENKPPNGNGNGHGNGHSNGHARRPSGSPALVNISNSVSRSEASS